MHPRIEVSNHAATAHFQGGRRFAFLACLFLFICAPARADEKPTTISDAKPDANGFLVHEITSPYQSGKTRIRVLLPEPIDKAKKYPVVYILPVEKLDENLFGDGLLQVSKAHLQDRHQAIFVAPTFSHTPWFADHPVNPEIRQESYLLKVVLPFIEKTYPATPEPSARLLLGFSKSGWGAFSLLLRHGDVFGKAAAWDAPLMMQKPNRWGSGEIFATQENFESYRIEKLLEKNAADFQQGNRLILLGFDLYRRDCQAADAVMENLKVSHIFHDGPPHKHEWARAWMAEAMDLLLPVAAGSEKQ